MANRDVLPPEDRLTRFIRSGKHVTESKGRVKHQAFMPPDDKKLSVFHIEHMNNRTIWKLADNHLGHTKRIRFRADISAGVVGTVGLKVVCDDEPEHHAEIVGWPDEKEKRKLRAMELAAQAELCSRLMGSKD